LFSLVQAAIVVMPTCFLGVSVPQYALKVDKDRTRKTTRQEYELLERLQQTKHVVRVCEGGSFPHAGAHATLLLAAAVGPLCWLRRRRG
jgi:hypothetical protein